MRKRGVTLIELLIVVALIGILAGVGGISIKKQAESRAMLRVKNEIGDFFRVTAKRSQETGKKYAVNFDLAGKKIEISRNGKITDSLVLPNTFKYGIKWGLNFEQSFDCEMESRGFLDKSFTIYVFKGTSGSGIGNDDEVKYAISFGFDDHIKYLHVREYLPVGTVTSKDIMDRDKSPGENPDLKSIKD